MDADKIKDFFLFHVEKMILVVVVGASGFLLYQGLQLDNYLDTHDPDRLGDDATQVKLEIDEDHNDAIIPPRIPTLDIVAQTQKRYNSVDPTPYKLPHLLERQGENVIVRREDPVLSPPQQLLVQGVLTAIAVRSASPDYPLAALDPADEVEKVEAPKVREPRQRRSRRGGGDMEEMMMMMGEFEEEEMEMEMEMDMESEFSSMAGGVRKFDPKFDFGTGRPSVGQDQKHPIPQTAWFIAGTALIPHQEMYDAFEKALRSSDNFTPTRDTPYYVNFEVQRADVTDKPVDQLADGDWIDVWNRRMYTILGARKWAGFAPEIVPEDYRDNMVTTWIPPVLLDDYRTFCSHPLIPMKTQAELEAEINAVEMDIVDTPDEELFSDDSTVLVAPGETGGDSYDQMDMEDAYEEMDMGIGMSLGFRSGGIERNPVEYKLIRFYDFRGFNNPPQPGRKYVYRVRYAVNDPNFPAQPRMQPKVSSLTADCAQRVLDKMAEAEANNERSYERWTDWSEPSAPISLPTREEHFAGPVEPGASSKWTIGGKQVSIMRDPPTAKIVASQYSDEFGTRVPLRLDVTEGSVLSAKVEAADIVDQLNMEVKKLPDAELVSGTTIVDLDGGAELSIADGLTAPGMMLLFESDGSLSVADDIGDQEFYRIHSYADERGE